MIKNHMKKSKKGFTLVELIVVLVIMAVLAAIFIPTLSGFIDKAKEMSSIVNTRQAYVASTSGLLNWIAAGSPGNGDKAYKINIESEIVDYLDLGEMTSYTKTESNENSVQVALSLPSYYSQGWSKFIDDCKNNNHKNFVRVWIGKNPDRTVGNSVKAVYYVSPDGKYASRVVYDEATKLGSVDQKTGVHFERID